MEQYSWCHTFILFQSAEEDYANHTDLWEPQWCAEVVWTSCIWLALPFQSHPYGMHTWICNWLLHMAMQHPGRMCCALWQSALGTKVHWKFHPPLGGVCPGGGLCLGMWCMASLISVCIIYVHWCAMPRQGWKALAVPPNPEPEAASARQHSVWLWCLFGIEMAPLSLK